jgi:hypothetical protein
MAYVIIILLIFMMFCGLWYSIYDSDFVPDNEVELIDEDNG